MAHGGTKKNGRKRESIADLVADLKLLREEDYPETRSNMDKARGQKIEKLRKANGTLDEVCFFTDQSFCKNSEMKEICYMRVI